MASLHSQLTETQQARHSLAVQLASLQAQLRHPPRPSDSSDGPVTPSGRIQAVPASNPPRPSASPGKAADPVLQQVQSAAAYKQVWSLRTCCGMVTVSRLLHCQHLDWPQDVVDMVGKQGAWLLALRVSSGQGQAGLSDHAACHTVPPLSQWSLQENETLLAVLGKLDQQCKELEASNTQLLAQLEGLPAPRSSAQQPAALRNLQQALDNVRKELAAERQLRLQAEHELQVI